MVIVAPHGGGIEPATSEIAVALAGNEFSLYCFEGLRPANNATLHITSIHFDEPLCAELIGHSRTAVTVHGCVGQTGAVHVGGLDLALGLRVIASLRAAGFDASEDRGDTAGRDPRNICNQGRSGKGLQLELDEGLRLKLFLGLTRSKRAVTRPGFRRFIAAVRKELLRVHAEGAPA